MMARTIAISGGKKHSPAMDLTEHAALEASLSRNLGAAIQIKTISWRTDAPVEADAFDAFGTFLEATYPAAHRRLIKEKINQSFLYRWPGRDTTAAPIGFIAHMDVVPIEPGTQANWVQPPFSGALRDGAVWGRGALDDKGSLIAIMEAVERLSTAGFQPRRDIYLIFGHDEELGGTNGAGAIAQTLKARGVHFAWTLDEGSVVISGAIPDVAAPVALISTAEKGSTTLRLIAKTQGGHSSAPGKETAVSVASKAVIAVNDTPYPLEIDENVVAFLHAIAPEVSFMRRLVLHNLWLTGPAVKRTLGNDPAIAATMRTTTAPTMIEGGTKSNILPQRATATVNFRIHPRDTAKSVRSRAEKLINDQRVTIEVAGAVEPSPNSSRISDGYRAISQSIRSIYGSIPIAPSLTIGGTDTRHFTALADDNYRFMPFIFETKDLTRLHGTNERVPVKDLVRATLWYEDLMKKSAGD